MAHFPDHFTLATPLPGNDPQMVALNAARYRLGMALHELPRESPAPPVNHSDHPVHLSDDDSDFDSAMSNRGSSDRESLASFDAASQSNSDAHWPSHRPRGLIESSLLVVPICAALLLFWSCWSWRTALDPLPDMSQCLLTAAGEYIIPSGVRAPLFAMAADLAMAPDYAERWLWFGMPFDIPSLNDSDNREVQKAYSKVRRLQVDEFLSPTELLPDWWVRISQPAQQVGPISQRLESAQAVRHTTNLTEYLTNVGMRAYCQWQPEEAICTPYLDSYNSTRAGHLVDKLVSIVHDACDPDSASSAPAFPSMDALRDAVDELETSVHDRLAQIAAQERARVTAIDRSSHHDAPLVSVQQDRLAPWSAAHEADTRNSKAFLLSPSWEILGTRVPSHSAERNLNALAAVDAHVLWIRMSTSAFDTLHGNLREMCSSAVQHTDILDQILKFLLSDLTSETEETRAAIQLAIGRNLLNDPTDNETRPLFDYDGAHHAEAARLGLGIGRSKRPVSNTSPTDSRDVPRTPMEKFWKSTVYRTARTWGLLRTPSDYPSKSITQRLSDCIQQDTQVGGRNTVPNDDTWLRDQATLAVYTFWLRGASPAWYTFQRPHPNSIKPSPDTSAEQWEPFEEIEGEMYDYFKKDENAGVRREVDLDLVAGWGRW